MKNLELKNLGVQELNANEMSTIEGGGIIGTVFTLLGQVGNTVGTVVSNTFTFAFTQLATILNAL